MLLKWAGVKAHLYVWNGCILLMNFGVESGDQSSMQSCIMQTIG